MTLSKALRALAPLLALAAASAVLVAACGTDAVAVEACRQVETARCTQASAQSCANVVLSRPVHQDSDVTACIRFYSDACLHGLANPTDPGAVAVKACVDVINAGDCTIVEHPEQAPACAWLIPPAPVVVVDAGVDAGVDAPPDAPDAG